LLVVVVVVVVDVDVVVTARGVRGYAICVIEDVFVDVDVVIVVIVDVANGVVFNIDVAVVDVIVVFWCC